MAKLDKIEKLGKLGRERARSWLKTSIRPSAAGLDPDNPTLPATVKAPPARVAACTDVGRVRRNNEDAFRYEDAGIYVVCDGMGGMAAGEVASQVAAETTVREFLRHHSEPGRATVQTRLAECVAAANCEVLLAAREPGRTGMGTTLVAAALDGAGVVLANVGDSRAYLLQKGVCRQITRDHSYANELQRIAGLQPEDIPPADLQRFGSLITRAIGAGEEVEPDFFAFPFGPGDLLLLATDGLTRYFEDAAALTPFLDPADLQGSCARLIDAANAAGGVDNITVLLLSGVALESSFAT